MTACFAGAGFTRPRQNGRGQTSPLLLHRLAISARPYDLPKLVIPAGEGLGGRDLRIPAAESARPPWQRFPPTLPARGNDGLLCRVGLYARPRRKGGDKPLPYT